MYDAVWQKPPTYVLKTARAVILAAFFTATAQHIIKH